MAGHLLDTFLLMEGEMGGKRPREKGDRLERKVVQLLEAAGITAKRMPSSGALGGEFAGDVKLFIGCEGRILECKKRASSGFASIYNWLAGHFGLVIAADRRERLIVLRLDDFIEIVSRLEKLERKYGEGV